MNDIICGDCVEKTKNISDSSIDMVLFSPPYDKIRDYNGFEIDMKSLGAEY